MIRRKCVMINHSHDPPVKTNQEKSDFVLEGVRLKWKLMEKPQSKDQKEI